MAEPHAHLAAHEIVRRRKRGILWGILLNFGFSLVELVVGLVTASLAVISNALHDFFDAFSFVLSYWGVALDRKQPTKRLTFGYHKAPIFIAFANALVLTVITLGILWTALNRLRNPEQITSSGAVIAIAALGLAVNGVATWLLAADRKNLNIRAAILHLASDFAGWALVLAMGIVLRFTDWHFLDPVITIVVSAAILWESTNIIKEGTAILLDIVPKDVSFDDVRKCLCDLSPFITDVHDLHIWHIGEDQISLSAHLVVKERLLGRYHALLTHARKELRKRFGITHATIELECRACGTEVCTPERIAE